MRPSQQASQESDLTAAVDLVHSHCSRRPTAAIVLGSGLGGLSDLICDPVRIPYADIPGFRTSSASGHRGQLILGQIESTPVVAMAGRLHRYEGWTNDEIAFPVRLMAAIGARRLIVSNAAGGVSPKLRVGDVIVIRDHINMMGGMFSQAQSTVPFLIRHGEIYDRSMSAVAMQVALKRGFNAYQGTYLATLGPTYETRSEYRMMRRMGADVAGMSTVPEVLAAIRVKLRVLGLSMVSNVANPDRPNRADHAEVLEAGRAVADKMEEIVRGVLRSA